MRIAKMTETISPGLVSSSALLLGGPGTPPPIQTKKPMWILGDVRSMSFDTVYPRTTSSAPPPPSIYLILICL